MFEVTRSLGGYDEVKSLMKSVILVKLQRTITDRYESFLCSIRQHLVFLFNYQFCIFKLIHMKKLLGFILNGETTYKYIISTINLFPLGKANRIYFQEHRLHVRTI